jgi:hypothetical protein
VSRRLSINVAPNSFHASARSSGSSFVTPETLKKLTWWDEGGEQFDNVVKAHGRGAQQGRHAMLVASRHIRASCQQHSSHLHATRFSRVV